MIIESKSVKRWYSRFSIFSQELQLQQDELRKNAEDMAQTQEILQTTNQSLEDKIEEVNRTQNRMQLLLENASEVISIYEEDGSIRYISPSVKKILGYEQKELIGINDIKHVMSESKEGFRQMFEKLIAWERKSRTITYP